MAFYERLRDLRKQANKTQSEIADYLGTTAQYYGRYENGECELPLMRAIELAKYYDVSLDYLAGRTNNRQGKFCPELTKEQTEFCNMYAHLNDKNKGRIEMFAEQLLDKQKNQK